MYALVCVKMTVCRRMTTGARMIVKVSMTVCVGMRVCVRMPSLHAKADFACECIVCIGRYNLHEK